MSDIEAKLREIEEMVSLLSRSELDSMAYSLELDASKYPNKRSLAEAILIRREQKEAKESLKEASEEGPEEVMETIVEEELLMEVIPEPTQEGVTVEEVKMNDETVRGKIQAFNDKAVEFREHQKELKSGIANFRSNIKELTNEFDNYAQTDFRDNITLFNQSVASFRESVKQLKKNFEAYHKSDFQDDVKALRQSVEEFKKSILQQFVQYQEYTERFWG